MRRRLLAALCVLSACGEAPQEESPAILATVGERQISEASLDRAAQSVGTDGTSDLDSWRQTLQLLIDRELLLLEGRRRGLHESAPVQVAVDATHRAAMTQALLEQHVGGPLTLSDEEARAWYDSTGAGREIRVARAVLSDRRAALAALRQVESSTNPDESLLTLDLPAEHLVTRSDLGWLSRLMSRDVRLAPLFDRDVGAVELIESDGYYFVMEVTAERQAPFEERRDVARDMLDGQRRSRVNMEYLEHLLAKYDVRIDTAVAQRLARTPDPGTLDPGTRLVQSSLGDWTVGEYVGAIDRLGADATVEATAAQGFRITRAFVVAELLPREAAAVGLADSLDAERRSAARRATIEALWATEGFDAESAVSEPDRFETYLEELRVRFADHVAVDEDAFAAFVAARRRNEAPTEY